MADDRVVKTTVELEGEESYSKKLKLINAQLKANASEHKLLAAQYDASDKSLVALTARQGAYQEKIGLLQLKLKAIEEEHRRVVEAEGENSAHAARLEADYNNLKAQLVSTERELQSINDEMAAAAEAAEETVDAVEDLGEAAEETASDARRLERAAEETADGVDQIRKRSDESSKALKKLGDELQSASGKAGKALFAGTAAVTGVSVQGFLSLEDEIATLSTIADENAMSMEAMSDAALDASNKTGKSAEEIAQAAYQAISAGVDTENAFGVTALAAKTAVAGLSDTETVIDGATSAINAWALGYENAEGVMDKFIVTQNYGKISVDQIASSIGSLTGLAPQLNVSLEEILAATAAMTKNGNGASESMTALRGVMSAILKPTAEATEAAKAMGLQFDAAVLQSKGLTGFLQDVYEATEGDSEKLALLFGNVEGLSAVMMLGSNAANDYAEALELLNNSEGQMEAAYEKKTSSRAAQLQKSLNTLRNNAIGFGEALAPFIDMVSEGLEKVNQYLSGLSEEEQKAILNTSLLVAGGLTAVSMISKVTAAVKTLKAAFSGPGGWVTLAIAGVAALTTGIIALKNALDGPTLEEAFDKVMQGVDEDTVHKMHATIDAELNIDPAKTKITSAFGDLYDAITTALTDGEADTEEVTNSLLAQTGDAIEKAYAGVDAWLAAEKAKLDPLATDYATRLGELEKTAEGYKETIASCETETVEFIKEMSGKSTAEVNARLGDLEAIEARVAEVTTALDEATAKAQEIGSVEFQITRAGGTTDADTIARGAQWARQIYKTESQANIDEAAQKRAQILDEWNQGLLTTEEYHELEKGIDEELRMRNEALFDVYRTRMTELLDGISEAYMDSDPESVEKLAKTGELLNAQDIIAALVGEVQSEDISIERTKEIQDIATELAEMLYPEENHHFEQLGSDLVAFYEQVGRDAAKELYSIEEGENPLLTALRGVLSPETAEALDIDTSETANLVKAMAGNLAKDADEAIAIAFEENTARTKEAAGKLSTGAIAAAKTLANGKTLRGEFEGVGADAIDGMIAGVNSKSGALRTAIRNAMGGALNEARATLDIHSPSRKFYQIGAYTGDGFINAVNDKTAAAQAAVRRMVSANGIAIANAMQAAQAARTAELTAAQGGNTTNVNVHYSGAYSRREALRFGKAVGDVLAEQALAKGG